MTHGPIPIPPGGAEDQAKSPTRSYGRTLIRAAGKLGRDFTAHRGALLAGTAVALLLAAETLYVVKLRNETVSTRAGADNAAALQLAIAQEKTALARKQEREAETQKEVAIQAAKLQLAIQEEKTALARKAESEAVNAPQRAGGEAKKAEGDGAVAIARSPYAEKLAQQELRIRTAEANLKEEEARKAAAETAKAKAEEYAARVRAEKEYQECIKAGVVAGALTGSQGCREILGLAAQGNGGPREIGAPTDAGGPKDLPAQRQVANDPRFAGFTEYPAEAGRGFLPVGLCVKNFQQYTRSGIAQRGKTEALFGAFAVNSRGTACHWTTIQKTQAEADAYAQQNCAKGSHDGRCRIISRHTNGQQTSAVQSSPAQRMVDYNLCATHKLMGGNSFLGGGPNCR